MPRRGNKRSRRNKQKGSAFHGAPKQGMGSTEDWIINDIQPILLPTGVGSSALTMRVSADANGFAWNISDSGTTIAQYPTSAYFQKYEGYGYSNNQFARLGQLWEQYRVDWIELEFQPTAASAGIAPTPTFVFKDEADLIGGSDGLGDLISKISSQRDVQIVTPYRTAKQRLNFAKYLGQGQDRAWLQTLDPGAAPLINREQYVTNLNSGLDTTARTPALGMVMGMNVGPYTSATNSAPIVLGVLRVRCKMTFRQRAALKDSPVLNMNRLIGFDTLENGAVMRVNVPMPSNIREPRQQPQQQYNPPQLSESVIQHRCKQLFEDMKTATSTQ